MSDAKNALYEFLKGMKRATVRKFAEHGLEDAPPEARMLVSKYLKSGYEIESAWLQRATLKKRRWIWDREVTIHWDTHDGTEWVDKK